MTFGRPLRKPLGVTARRRASKGRKLKREERDNKALVRARDGAGHGRAMRITGRCRFPLCGCHERGLFVEVAHQCHKGMGGDPTGERSQPELMICLCNWRHKEARFSVDKGNVRWVPLTDQGANGPVAWEVKLPSGWAAFAREIDVQILDAIEPRWQAVLAELDTF